MIYEKKGYKPWNKGKTGEEIKSHYKNGFGQGRIPLVYGLASMRRKIRDYKKHAKKLGLEYNLTENQFHIITQKDCYYCGAKPNNIYKKKDYNGEYIYNGIDRVDNKRGYIIDNVVPCCKVCNFQKKTFTLQEFKDWIEMVYFNLIQNKSK